MHSYQSVKEKYGRRVSQTIDSPILIFDYFELSDVFTALFVIMVFGILASTYLLMFAMLAVVLGVVPLIKRRNHKGIFFHWPFRKFGMSLPGLINSKGTRKFSD